MSSTSSAPEPILFLPPNQPWTPPPSSPSALSPSSPGTGTGNTQPALEGPIVAAYYPDWVLATLPPENIDFARFDWIDYAFTWPGQNLSLLWDSPGSPAILQRLVAVAHANGKKVKISVGGWDGGTSVLCSAPCVTCSQ